MPLTVVAFDPGNAPSAAVYWGTTHFILFPPLGVERSITRKRKDNLGIAKSVKGVTNTPDIPKILDIYRQYLPDIVVVETIGSRPGEGIASVATFNKAAGTLEGIAYGASLNGVTRLTTIRPQEWRRAWRMPEGKEQSRLVAQKLFPSRSADFKLVKSHNVADPLLMAVYVYHHQTGTPLQR